MFIENLSTNPVFYVSWLASVILSVTLHELGHVFAALRQGDDTPRILGRVTLDPVVHMGVPSLVMAALLGLAWGVTPTNPSAFRGRHGRAYVAFAGPLVNLVLAFLGLTALALLLRDGGRPNNLHQFLAIFGSLNLILFVFNMLPIPPLDGATVVGDFSPGFDRLRYVPEAQPWFLAALFGAVILLMPPLQKATMALAMDYVQLFR